jgi:peptidoglycan hydrolase CwlO-like protein
MKDYEIDRLLHYIVQVKSELSRLDMELQKSEMAIKDARDWIKTIKENIESKFIKILYKEELQT